MHIQPDKLTSTGYNLYISQCKQWENVYTCKYHIQNTADTNMWKTTV